MSPFPRSGTFGLVGVVVVARADDHPRAHARARGAPDLAARADGVAVDRVDGHRRPERGFVERGGVGERFAVAALIFLAVPPIYLLDTTCPS